MYITFVTRNLKGIILVFVHVMHKSHMYTRKINILNMYRNKMVAICLGLGQS
jgi:hypothetical protein